MYDSKWIPAAINVKAHLLTDYCLAEIWRLDRSIWSVVVIMKIHSLLLMVVVLAILPHLSQENTTTSKLNQIRTTFHYQVTYLLKRSILIDKFKFKAKRVGS